MVHAELRKPLGGGGRNATDLILIWLKEAIWSDDIPSGIGHDEQWV